MTKPVFSPLTNALIHIHNKSDDAGKARIKSILAELRDKLNAQMQDNTRAGIPGPAGQTE